MNSLALNCDYVLRTGAFQLGLIGGIGGTGGKGTSGGVRSSSSGVKKVRKEGEEEVVAVEGEGEEEEEVNEDLSLLQQKALERYQAVVGAEGEKLVSG